MARYRVTAEGFQVHQQTWDHALEVDGKGDEVFIAAHIARADEANNQVDLLQRVSKEMGDINHFPHRVLAGSLSPKGGLQTGDTFPYSDPWRRQTDLKPEQPPMILWEGELSPGKGILIMPSIWEWDGGRDLFNGWGSTIAENLPKIVEAVKPLLPNGSTVALVAEAIQKGVPPLFALLHDILGEAGDRPIGMQKDNNNYVFKPKIIQLNAATAEEAIQTDAGFGRGVLPLVFEDAPELGSGRYSLYVRVENVQSPSPDPSYKTLGSLPLISDPQGPPRTFRISVQPAKIKLGRPVSVSIRATDPNGSDIHGTVTVANFRDAPENFGPTPVTFDYTFVGEQDVIFHYPRVEVRRGGYPPVVLPNSTFVQ